MSREEIDTHEKFMFTLEWILAVTKRYSGRLEFGLAHIDFENPKVLGEVFGAQQASHKLDDVLRSLRKAIRKTDLVARDGADFWILVPHAQDEEKLVDRIREIVELASRGGLQIVERDLSLFSIPNDTSGLKADFTALEFLAHLKKNHVTLASHELSLPSRK